MSTRLEQLKDFLKESPNDSFLKYALASEYLKLNDKDMALHYYEDLMANHADYVGTYYHLGKLYEALDRGEEAIKTYEKGIHIARGKRDMHAMSELQAAYYAASGMDADDDDF